MAKTISYPTMATVKEAAHQFSVSAAFVRKLCREGRIRYTAISSRNGWSIWTASPSSLSRESPCPNRPNPPTHPPGCRQLLKEVPSCLYLYSYRGELFCKAQQRRVCSRNASNQKGWPSFSYERYYLRFAHRSHGSFCPQRDS